MTLRDSFEDWTEAAKEYAADHPELELWPFQVDAMASDFAWRWEGCIITPQTLDKAYEDWISGYNPYSVHSVALPGYDRDENHRRLHDAAVAQYREFGLANGIEEWQVDRFVADMEVELYFRKRDAERDYADWISIGKYCPTSPYHIPFDPVNVAERQERLDYLLSYYPDHFVKLFYPDAQQYGSLSRDQYYEEHYQEYD